VFEFVMSDVGIDGSLEVSGGDLLRGVYAGFGVDAHPIVMLHVEVRGMVRAVVQSVSEFSGYGESG
jgi:hypothetical protein